VITPTVGPGSSADDATIDCAGWRNSGIPAQSAEAEFQAIC